MKGELPASSEPNPDPKATAETSAPRPRKRKARSTEKSAFGPSTRFFLSKPEGGNGTPALDREFDSEPEAMVESLKTGRNYFVISEWKGLADVSKRIPLIRKEAITNKKAPAV